MANDTEEFNIDALADYEEEGEGNDKNKQKNGDATTTSKPGGQTAFLNTTFRDLLLIPELLRAIVDSGFELPSTVQSKALPAALIGTDILCQAKAGTGKTAIFVLGVLQQLSTFKGTSSSSSSSSGSSSSSSSGSSSSSKPSESKDSNNGSNSKDSKEGNSSNNNKEKLVSCVVLCHNRELAYQIYDEFNRFSKYLQDSVSVGVFFGGTKSQADRDRLKNDGQPDIVIGTPGRTLQLVKENCLKLSAVKYFVIDECDQVLEQLGMRSDVQRIFKSTPRAKQVMMFSATLSKELKGVCSKFMRSPLEIVVEDQKSLVVSTLNQYAVELKEEEKTRKLLELLDELEFNQVMIFVSSQARAEALDTLLKEQAFPSVSMWGKLDQVERIKRFKEFKDFKHRVMVSTNMLGRGIDVVRVNVVINYDMAGSVEMYLHRVGRAGRFSTKGLAISFVRVGDEEEKGVLEKVRKTCGIAVPDLPNKIDPNSYMNKNN